MAATVMVKKQAIIDLLRVKEDFDTIVESLELMGNKDFTTSYRKAKEQIRKRNFADWNEL